MITKATLQDILSLNKLIKSAYRGETYKKGRHKEEHKLEEKMSRTLELNSIKEQALKELGYNQINETNASEVLEKMAEIQSRKVTN